MEGLLSFFSPCVLPLVPLYMAYLSSGTVIKDGDNTTYNQKKTFILTLFFIIGICSTFIVLAFSISTLNKYISNYRNIIGIIGGIILIVFGLNQIGILKIKFLNKEIRFDYRFENNKINYLEAFMLGFVFSFAWTPCIGPMLSNAIILSTQDSLGSVYIIIYALGLVIPFLITGIFTTSILKFINSNKKIVRYTGIISGVIVICFGIYMIYNVAYIKSIDSSTPVVEQDDDLLPNGSFITLEGNEVSLYSDKGVVLHYIASWCHYCIDDLPDFEDFCNRHNELTCYLVMNEEYNRAQGGSSSLDFYYKYKPSIEIINDYNLALYNYLGIKAAPSTYFSDGKGAVFGVIPGAAYDKYDDVYNQFLEK